MTICSKIVDYISGHKQFDVASAISNLKKITITGNISGENEVILLYCALKCNGTQDDFFLV